MNPVADLCRLALGVVALALPVLVQAQFKVVAPDGTVTYTDRQPVDRGLKVQPLRRDGSAAGGSGAAAAVELPFALRSVVARYPVTLYTAPNCAACDSARAALRARGVPHTERVASDDDGVRELRRLEQTTEVPVLRLGRQQLVGYAADEWQSTLDAAGYPRSSVLPTGWRQPAPEPLAVARQEDAAAAAAPAVVARPTPPSPVAPANPGAGGIRF
ncbi:glutaredoxin family protein [Leptothrix discophora]|uniref:Glutaredoxin family protein n=1 Tax=Leptothrix discophora TaxID=89 RepID=A0ABT9G538_LEPDI|nr:glutaredoxin family protein [Leptothrix discophora]MDP4301598.1 glutaredoxin family protein [Leptothrix discophora]